MLGHNVIRNKVNNILIRDVDIAHIIKNSETVRNNIEARCQIFRGELSQNSMLGIPVGDNKEDLDLAIMDIVNNTIGVRNINKFESYVLNKKYHVSMIILTEYNDEINVEV